MMTTPIVTQLRKLRPVTVLVYDLDDDEGKTVKVGTGRKCWDRVAQTIAGMEWARAECLDKDGHILGVVRNDDARNTGGASSGRPSPDTVAQYLDVMLRAQKEANAATRAIFEPVVATLTEAVKSGQARAEALERSTLNMLRLVARTTITAAENEAAAIVAEAEAEAEAEANSETVDKLANVVLGALTGGQADEPAEAAEGANGKPKKGK